MIHQCRHVYVRLCWAIAIQLLGVGRRYQLVTLAVEEERGTLGIFYQVDVAETLVDYD